LHAIPHLPNLTLFKKEVRAYDNATIRESSFGLTLNSDRTTISKPQMISDNSILTQIALVHHLM